jgi:hypothetical protein
MHCIVHNEVNMSTDSQLSGELQAMVRVEGALTPLQEDERARVLRWASERFGVSIAMRSANSAAKGPATNRDGGGGGGDTNSGDANDHVDLAEFFAAARPKSDLDKALVVGYWFQYRVGNTELEAQAINTELKHLGHQVGNITRAFDNLMAKDPQLIVQTRKSGSSKQARKKYKLTTAGKKEVERMLAVRDAED